jgi:hypothetical protein
MHACPVGPILHSNQRILLQLEHVQNCLHCLLVCSTIASLEVCEAYELKADATNESAMGGEKIHVSTVSFVSCPFVDFDDVCQNTTMIDGRFEYHGVEAGLKCAGDLQAVSHGTGEETYGIFKRQLQSVSSPTWEDRVETAFANYSRFTMFLFGLDGGGDNKGIAAQYAQPNSANQIAIRKQIHCLKISTLYGLSNFFKPGYPSITKYIK